MRSDGVACLAARVQVLALEVGLPPLGRCWQLIGRASNVGLLTLQGGDESGQKSRARHPVERSGSTIDLRSLEIAVTVDLCLI